MPYQGALVFWMQLLEVGLSCGEKSDTGTCYKKAKYAERRSTALVI